MRPAAATAVALSVLCACVNAAQAACIEVSETRAAPSTAGRVTAGSTLTVDPTCELATSAAGPWRTLPEDAKPHDYASLWIALGGRDAATPPVSIYARRAKAPERVESIFLAACTEHLLAPGHGFEMRVPSDLQQPQVKRAVAASDCGARDVALHFVRPWRDGQAPLVHAGPKSMNAPGHGLNARIRRSNSFTSELKSSLPSSFFNMGA